MLEYPIILYILDSFISSIISLILSVVLFVIKSNFFFDKNHFFSKKYSRLFRKTLSKITPKVQIIKV